jgi:glycosyltransferase involved in cell wall biosynthesis
MSTLNNRPRIAAIILTKNEERDLPDCLHSLQDLATEIYIIDSGSTDRTIRIAQKFGATILTHAFENYARQFNWALDNISTNADWILRIDADERVHPLLARELLRLIPGLPIEVTGLVVPLRIRFMGRDMRFGDMYPVWLLRLWRGGTARCEDRWMDEYIQINSGRSIRVHGDLIHEIPKSLTEWTAKHNWYATRECADILAADSNEPLKGNPGARRRMKQAVYFRLPLFYRALIYWLYRYVFKLGFLDGKEGLIYHFLHGFWYRFLVDAKLYESVAGQLPGQKESFAATEAKPDSSISQTTN